MQNAGLSKHASVHISFFKPGGGGQEKPMLCILKLSLLMKGALIMKMIFPKAFLGGAKQKKKILKHPCQGHRDAFWRTPASGGCLAGRQLRVSFSRGASAWLSLHRRGPRGLSGRGAFKRWPAPGCSCRGWALKRVEIHYPLKHNGHLSPCGVIQIQYQLKAIPILPQALLCNTLIVAGLG